MFRRREDSLFDSATDPNEESVESASPAGASAPIPSASSPSGNAGVAPAYAQSMPRPPVAAQSGGFRSSGSAIGASPISDLSRSRMPEAGNKPAGIVSSSPSSQMPAASSVPSSPVSSPEKSGKHSAARRVLTVGNDILLKGEIATCDRLVIEGKVEATLNDVHTVEISEHGSFKGSANIEDAEIRGLFEGDLIVRNRLVIHATGKVRGKITYGEIEVERGGEFSGEIKTNSVAATPSYAPRTRQNKDDKVAA